MVKKSLPILLLAMVFGILYLGIKQPFTKGYTLFFHIYNVRGLEEGDHVYVRGVDAGQIREIALERDDQNRPRAKVTTFIQEAYRVEKGSEAIVTPYGFMGGSYLSVLPPAHPAENVKPGAHLYGEKGVTLSEMLRVDKNTSLPDFSRSRFSDSEFVKRLRGKIYKWRDMADSLDRKLTGKNEDVHRKVQSVSKITSDWIEKIQAIFPKIDRLTKRMNDTLDDTGMRLYCRITTFRETSDRVVKKWRKTVKRIQEEVFVKKNSMVSATQSADTRIRNLREISDDWRGTLTAVDSILDKVLNGKGLLNKILKDRKISANMEKIFSHAETLTRVTGELLEDIRRNPDKYTVIHLVERKGKNPSGK